MTQNTERNQTFGDLLEQWMYTQNTPEIVRARGERMTWQLLASIVGVSRQTAYNWRDGTKPQAEMLPIISEKTGLPIEELYRAAGYPLPRAIVDGFVGYAIRRLENDGLLCAEHHKSGVSVGARLRELGEEYLANGSGDATDAQGH